MVSRWLRFVAALLICAAFGASTAGAHDLPLDRFMNAFVKTEPNQADLVIRVPLDLLRAIHFTVDRSGHYNVVESQPEVNAAVAALASDLSILENGVRLVPSSSVGVMSELQDRSFVDFEQAAAHIAQPVDPDTNISFELGYLDAHFVYPITSTKSVFTFQTRVASDLRETAKTAIRYIPYGESARVMVITAEDGRISLDPPWYEAAGGFVKLGVEHILTGIDHMLFLLCLIIPFRRLKPLIPVVTAFTLGHSVTLIGTAFGLTPAGTWFPPLVETGIAASIVYMALENIAGADLRRRWIIAGLFGLVHGFGFSYALKEDLQFAGSHLLVSLFSFNVGIEIGQLIVLCAFLPALALLFRGSLSGRMGVILLSAVVAHTAWHWMEDRFDIFWQTPWPVLTPGALIVLAQWAASILVAVGAAVFLSRWIERKWPRFVQRQETASTAR